MIIFICIGYIFCEIGKSFCAENFRKIINPTWRFPRGLVVSHKQFKIKDDHFHVKEPQILTNKQLEPVSVWCFY